MTKSELEGKLMTILSDISKGKGAAPNQENLSDEIKKACIQHYGSVENALAEASKLLNSF